jgi:CPA1 family monovalent cation:H+ antiporter
VSTQAITRFVRIPKSMAAILEGESLLNDASSLIIFRFALIAVGTGQFIWHQAAFDFLWTVSGGVGFGLGLGWLFVQTHKRLPTDAPSDIALTLIEPYFMYWAAEQIHGSGVLAVVSGGLFMANRQLLFLTSTSRVRGFSVWESFVFILNGLVFLLIGLQLPDIVDGLATRGIPLSTAIGYGLLVTGVLVLARIISAYAAMVATLIFRPSVAPQGRSSKARWLMPLLLGWTGMRGVVSLAAALAIPVALSDGTGFPHRSLILFITFVVILLTLVVQGLTLPGLIRRSGLFNTVAPDDPEDTVERRIRRGLHEHTLRFLREQAERELPENAGMREMLAHWEAKVEATPIEPKTGHMRELVLAMLESQRQHLVEVNRDPAINEEVIRQQLYLIDLEEERLRLKM